MQARTPQVNPSQQNRVQMKTTSKMVFIMSTCLLMAGLPACSTLPTPIPVTPQYAYEVDTSNTSLAQLVLPLKQQNPGLTGYHILYEPLDAIDARFQLIDKAEKSLDLQYYIWDNDRVGALALYKIIQAADRGVKVRLLIDDNNAKPMESIYLALDQHQNIDVKLFNPYRFRRARPLDMILDLKRINRRMHNKTFTVDNQITLIGGRNMSNQYYNVSDNYQFSDVDVVLVGQAVEDITHSFDEYWNYSYAYPVRDIVNHQQYTLRYDSLKQQLQQHFEDGAVRSYLEITNASHDFDRWLNTEIKLDWVKAEVIKDAPDKIQAKAKKEQHLNFQLVERVAVPEKSVDIISAYFVPEKKGAERLSTLAQQGVKVRVLTNSFKANDVALVHAFYARYRQDLLKNGVELYEFLPAIPEEFQNKNNPEISKQSKVSLKGLSRSSLHAKMMALDNKQVFIGSFNFDPRSANLNTEIGVILNSPPLASTIHSTMDQNLRKYAFKLVLDSQDKINWKQVTPDGVRVRTKEPQMKWWQKIGIKVISWLPIEGYM